MDCVHVFSRERCAGADGRVSALGVLSSRDEGLCHTPIPAITEFPSASHRPTKTGFLWTFDGTNPQGFLIPAQTFRHANSGGFSVMMKIVVDVDSNTGAPPADATLLSLSSADDQVSWRIQSDVAGTMTVVLCLNGICASATTTNNGAFSLSRYVGMRYSAHGHRVDIFENGHLMRTTNSAGMLALVWPPCTRSSGVLSPESLLAYVGRTMPDEVHHNPTSKWLITW